MSRRNISVTNEKVNKLLDEADNASKLIENALLSYENTGLRFKIQQAIYELRISELLEQKKLLEQQAEKQLDMIHGLCELIEIHTDEFSVNLQSLGLTNRQHYKFEDLDDDILDSDD